MRGPKYKIDRSSNNYYPQEDTEYNNEKNLDQAKKLYFPYYNNNRYKSYNNSNYYNNNSNKYKNIKQIISNYMNDYEKLRRQNKIPKMPQNEFNYKEFERKKNNIKELFDGYMIFNAEEKFSDTNKLIENLPDDNNKLLENDILYDDYNKRLKILYGEEETTGIKNQDNNKLNEKCYPEENNEDEDSPNKDSHDINEEKTEEKNEDDIENVNYDESDNKKEEEENKIGETNDEKKEEENEENNENNTNKGNQSGDNNEQE